MTDEQLDMLEREAKRTYEWEQKPNGYTEHCQARIYQDDLLALIAELRRLRKLERKRDKARLKLKRLEQAVKQVIYHQDYTHIGRHWFKRERATQDQVDAIGRLLEGKDE